MEDVEKSDSAIPSVKKSGKSSDNRYNVVWIAVGFLVIGFFVGVVVGVYKSGSIPMGQFTGDAPAKSQSPEMASRIEALSSLVQKNPHDLQGWIDLGDACFDANRYQEAIRAYQKALDINPQNANVWTDMGVMYRLSGKPREAIHAFDKAAEIDPKHEISRIDKGIVLLYDLNDKAGAIRAWESVLAINPLAALSSGQSVEEMLKTLKQQATSSTEETK